MTDEQNGWNAAYTKGTLRRPTNTDKLVPDGMEPGGSETDWAWYGVGAIAAVAMLSWLAWWIVEIWTGRIT